MHKENEDKEKQQGNVDLPPETRKQLEELSDVWRELLGNRVYEMHLPVFPGNLSIPTLEADPWSALLQANGVEVVDLQRIHLRISDQEVEQILQVIPDDPGTGDISLLGASEHSPSDSGRDSSKHTDRH
jgi:hypothetical protein